jgi:hypothetical protein
MLTGISGQPSPGWQNQALLKKHLSKRDKRRPETIGWQNRKATRFTHGIP